MSIVTDALNRLQSARARSEQTSAAHDPAHAQANTPELQDDEKPQTVDRTFVSVSIGGFLLALAVAMGAYWWGEYPVSEIPQSTASVSVRTDRLLDLSMDEALDPVSADLDPLSSVEDDELLPGGLPPLSPSSDDQEDIEIVETMDDQDRELTVSLSPHAMAESLSEDESRMPDVSSLPIEQETLAGSGNAEQEFNDNSMNLSREALDVSTNESIAKVRSSLREADTSSESRLALSETSEANSQSLRSSESTEVDHNQRATDSGISHEPRPSDMAIRPVVVTATSLSPKQRLLKARLLIEQQSYPEAITTLQPLFGTPPSTWEPWFWLGTAQFGLGELEKAEESFMEGLVRDETVPYLWVQRAVIEQQRGEYGKAMDALRQAELLDPKLPEVQLNLAYNLEHQGQVNLARRHYRQYLVLTEGKSAYHAVRRKVLERILRM